MSADEHRWWEATQRRLNLAERARLAALIDEVAALRVALRNNEEAYELCRARADAAERGHARLEAEGDTLWAIAENQARKVIRLRRAALLLRDAWRAERGVDEPVPLLTPAATLAERKEWQP